MVLGFELVDAPLEARRWWLVVRANGVELCLQNPGYKVDLQVSTRVATFAEVWLGQRSPAEAVHTGAIRLEGASALVQRFSSWCPRSHFADVGRERAVNDR